MKVTIDVDPLQLFWLRELLGDTYASIEEVLQHLVECTAEGLRRDGSWEAQFVAMAFGDHGGGDAGWLASAVGHAEAWQRPAHVASGEHPAGWVGRVVRGDLTIAYDSKPFPSRVAALADARHYLAASGLTPVEEVLREPYSGRSPVLGA